MKEHEVDWTPLSDIKPVRDGVRARRGYSVFTRDQADRIIRFQRDNDIPAAWIMRHFGALKGSVYNVMQRRIKHFARPVTQTMTDGQFKRIHKSYMKGATLGEISASLGCSRHALKANFKRLGLAERSRYKADREQVKYLFRKGHTAAEIAIRLNVSKVTINNIRREIRESMTNAR